MLICEKHGEYKRSCKKCAMERVAASQRRRDYPFMDMIRPDWQEKIRNGEVANHVKVVFVCKDCGKEFERTLNTQLSLGQGCPHCWKERRGKSRIIREYHDIKHEVHADDYKKIQNGEVKAKDKVRFWCEVHQEYYLQTIKAHREMGQGCPKCGNVKKGISNRRKKYHFEDLLDFEERRKLNNGEYSMSDTIKYHCRGCGNLLSGVIKNISRTNCLCKECQKIKFEETNLKNYGIKYPYLKKEAVLAHSTSRKEETKAYELLQNNLTVEVLREVNYPNTDKNYRCDFAFDYKSKRVYIEFNGNWTHGFEPFNKENPKHSEQLEKWLKKSSESDYCKAAIKCWTVTDVEKKNLVLADNSALYLPFYSIKQLRNALTRELKQPELKNTSKDINSIVNHFQWEEKYKHEIMWFNECAENKLFIYANRYKHAQGNPLPWEITDSELFRGIGAITKLSEYYSGFNTANLRNFIKGNKVKSLLDPFAGWGHRMIECFFNGVDYTGIEINCNTFKGLENIRDYLYDTYGEKAKITLYNDDCFEVGKLFDECDCVYSCIPYLGKEIYSAKGAENLPENVFYIKFKSFVEKHLDKIQQYVIMNEMLDGCNFNGVFNVYPYKTIKSHYNKASKNINEYVITTANIP